MHDGEEFRFYINIELKMFTKTVDLKHINRLSLDNQKNEASDTAYIPLIMHLTRLSIVTEWFINERVSGTIIFVWNISWDNYLSCQRMNDVIEQKLFFVKRCIFWNSSFRDIHSFIHRGYLCQRWLILKSFVE